ncbi:MAG: hypothetical protein JST50_02625 [Bacteroidetes bacterium]|nr:hypothetical protein [Bacteroidota bacterium]
MENQIIPTKAGQICTKENDTTGDVYIITEDPLLIDDNEEITVVRLGDLQRNVNDPSKAPRKKVVKRILSVVGEDLEDYIDSFNK